MGGILFPLYLVKLGIDNCSVHVFSLSTFHVNHCVVFVEARFLEYHISKLCGSRWLSYASSYVHLLVVHVVELVGSSQSSESHHRVVSCKAKMISLFFFTAKKLSLFHHLKKLFTPYFQIPGGRIYSGSFNITNFSPVNAPAPASASSGA